MCLKIVITLLLKAIIVTGSACFAAPSNLPARVDIKVYHVRGSKISSAQLNQSLNLAKKIFAEAGVQLNIVFTKRIEIPKSWLKVQGDIPSAKPASTAQADFYKNIEAEKSVIPQASIDIFSSIIDRGPEDHRVIHLLTLLDVRTSYFEADSKGRVRMQTISTGGFSFPSYGYEERLPKFLRGIVTLQSPDPRDLAHELGHKLINVSHEWRHICPANEIEGDKGLMLYGNGREIPSGREGRYHHERLHLSPFIYHFQNGKKVWNQDYQAHGRYDDPIYGPNLISPACPP